MIGITILSGVLNAYKCGSNNVLCLAVPLSCMHTWTCTLFGVSNWSLCPSGGCACRNFTSHQ